MKPPVRILHLEDDPLDAELVQSTLETQGIRVQIERVDTREDFASALERGGIDLILADYNLPSFNGLAALEMARQLAVEVPFLFVSGLIGEERALESLKTGATDYVFKHNLGRLGPAVERALDEAAERAERRWAEGALRESEGTLRSFFDTAPFMMGVVEMVGDDIRHLSNNLATAKFFGTTSQAMRGRRGTEIGCPRKCLNQWVAAFRKARETSLPVQFDCAEEQNGKTVWLSITVSELAGPPGQPPRFCYVAEDITEKRQLEQQFLRAQRMESIGTLAGGIAHDLNNVLAPIIMSLKLFRPKLSEPEDQDLLSSLESSARRGADIVRQVLTFARGVEGVRDTLQFPKLVSDLGRIARDTFPRSIQIDVQIPEDLWKATGDSTQIYQVLMNLCVNARDAMPEGGRLRIAAENVLVREPRPHLFGEVKPGPYVALSVADTGTGIPPEVIDKIFEPFFTTKQIGQGTGLGLSTVLSIVKSHGGFLNATSQVGQGTEMKVFLPAETVAPRGPLEARGVPVSDGKGQIVLVVDDEPAIRLVTKRTLEQSNYCVLLAADGAEALAMFAKQRNNIHAIVTDMMMPTMDGATLVRALRRFDPTVPIVGVSGLMDDRKASEMAGFDGVVVLHKPFPADKLLVAVQRALESRNSTPSLGL